MNRRTDISRNFFRNLPLITILFAITLLIVLIGYIDTRGTALLALLLAFYLPASACFVRLWKLRREITASGSE